MITSNGSRWDPKEVGCSSHFLDSGSFNLWTKAMTYTARHGGDPYAFYDSAEHWAYLDAYARFVKRYRLGIDLYANVDVIPDRKLRAIGRVGRAAELSWRNQKYLERKHGLRPVPVVHLGTELKWLKRYMDEGYDLIGLGGVIGIDDHSSTKWLDRCFHFACPPSKCLPVQKLHGFGITGYDDLVRYPWWSVDSSSWTKVGAYGGILVPRKLGEEFTFFEDRAGVLVPVRPWLVKVAMESSKKQKERGEKKRAAGHGFLPKLHNDREIIGSVHYAGLTVGERQNVREWLDLIGIPLGRGEGENIAEYGVTNRHSERKAANLYFYERLRQALPVWPWPFQVPRKEGFVY
jgi:hypothetical protein